MTLDIYKNYTRLAPDSTLLIAPSVGEEGTLHIVEEDYDMHTNLTRQQAIDLISHIVNVFNEEV